MPGSDAARAQARAFEAAREASGAPGVGRFSVGGRVLELRCVGAGAFAELRRSLLPAPAGGEPLLVLELWDAEELTLPRPEIAWPPGAEAARDGEGTLLGYLGDGALLRAQGEGYDVVLERRSRRATGWLAPSRLAPWERLRPFQQLLVAALADLGLECFHAGMVCAGGRGVLLPGANGAGKSTACLAGLAAGLGFLGDDAIALELGGRGAQGHALHPVVKLNAHALAAYPAFAGRGERFVDPLGDEEALRASELPPAQVAASACVAAIAFPRTRDASESRLTPLPPAACAVELLRSALSAARGRLAETFEVATTLAAAVPAYRLELGRDPVVLGAALAALLREPGAAAS